MEKVINVFSEIGKLKSVLVHKPGREVENLTPDTLERLLFDDIPHLEVAIKEHDYFCKIMKDNGVEVLYVEELAAETLDVVSENIKKDFINIFIKEAKVKEDVKEALFDYLNKLNNKAMIDAMIAGISKKDLDYKDDDDYPFICDPLPNVLFQRDPFASIGNGVSLNKMWSITRNRETIFPDLIFKHHPRFKNKVSLYYDRSYEHAIEGGDVLVLNDQTLIIGATQRTSLEAIEKISSNLFEKNSKYKKVIALDVPKSRAFMHLDTVFTNVDYDKFLVHPLIFSQMDLFKIYEITPEHGKKLINLNLKDYLSQVINKKAIFIPCGGDDPVVSGREQWNDGTNVLTIRPGVVIAYNRNYVTNQLLRDHGVTVYETLSSELSRGRGGPRCMTMPIFREEI